MAHFRFGVVGRLFALPPEGSLEDQLEALAAKSWPHPTRPGEEKAFGYSTISAGTTRATPTTAEPTPQPIRVDRGPLPIPPLSARFPMPLSLAGRLTARALPLPHPRVGHEQRVAYAAPPSSLHRGPPRRT